MSRTLRMKDGSSIDLVGVGAIVILGITIAFVVQQVAPVVSLYKHPPKEVAGVRDNAESTRKHAETLAWDRDQARNRSLFFVPPEPDKTVTDEPKARKYEGPSLSMFVNGTAYFSDGQKVSAAEPDSQSLHFVRADPPWSVRVRWRGGEFDVPIFEKIQLSSLTSSLAGSFPTSGSSHPAGSVTGPTSPDQPGGAASTDGKTPPPTDAPQPPPPMTNGGGPGAAGGGGGGGDQPPPPPPGGGGGSGPPPGEPSGPPPGSPPGSPAPAPAAPSGSPAPPPSEPAHPSDHR